MMRVMTINADLIWVLFVTMGHCKEQTQKNKYIKWTNENSNQIMVSKGKGTAHILNKIKIKNTCMKTMEHFGIVWNEFQSSPESEL